MISGRTKTKVFPEPVNAIPIMSLPDKMTGSPCTWIGVGWTMPFSFNSRRMGSGNLMSLKFLIGGGASSPSTIICHCFRIASHCFLDILLIDNGGFHPVQRGSVYVIPLANSRTDISVFLSERCSIISFSCWTICSVGLTSGTSFFNWVAFARRLGLTS
uniref:Uncharacterized protein n=1 Tax=Opuntia streptacantha TaxID=393608 RepID=A0A7C9DWJ6_OPUST